MVHTMGAILAYVGDPPPQPFIPSPGESLLGWMMGLAVFAGPLVLVLASWHHRHGHWWYVLSQWNTGAFWMTIVGAAVAAVGMFGLVGAVPAWQSQWTSWYLATVTTNAGSDLTPLTWLQALQQQYAFTLQVATGVIFLLGATGVVVGQSRLARKMAVYRRQGPDDWLVSSSHISTQPDRSASPPLPIE
jgi:hypothetical protein